MQLFKATKLLSLSLMLCYCCWHLTASTESTIKPLICAAMLSFNRPHYLIPSVRALISYMTAVEPGIPWTLQILDNGSGPEALANITHQLAPLKQMGLVRLVHLNENVGLSRGFNLLFFEMCASTGAPYLLSLEDDWRARLDWPASFPVMRTAMQLLDRHDRLLEVWVRDTHIGFRIHKNTTWQQETFIVPDYYSPALSSNYSLQLHVRHQECDPKSHPWGGYTNGASLKHFGRLQSLGRMPHVDGEADYSAKACAEGYHIAYICQSVSCYEPVKQWHWGLFEHTGIRRVDPAQDARYKNLSPLPPAKTPAEPTVVPVNDALDSLPHHDMLAASSVQEGKNIYIRAVGQQQWGILRVLGWVQGCLVMLGVCTAVVTIACFATRGAWHVRLRAALKMRNSKDTGAAKLALQ